jgi:mannose/fructose-specific phosphotransferase system component IIA
MSEEDEATGIVVGHGAMARGLVDAVKRIVGDVGDCLEPLSNDGKNPSEIKRDLEAMLGTPKSVIFVDLMSGSCGMAALANCHDCKGRVVVSGVNLPMLLDFVFNRGMPLADLVPRLLEQGRAAIVALPASE